MSDLSAAAAAMGLPESLVQRSAEARSAETGASVDDILAQWAGGEAAPGSAPPDAPTEEAPTPDEDVAEPVSEEAPPAPEVAIEVPEEPAEAPVAAPAGPYRPPVLVGTRDNPMTVLAGIIGLFIIVVMVGLVGPSIPMEVPGARSSQIDFTETALQGRDIYLEAGCAACHTQMVRPVVADVGLGAATLNDTNQVLGTRRFGPDLAQAGARLTPAQIGAIIAGLGDHPPLELGTDELDALVAYLSESASGEES